MLRLHDVEHWKHYPRASRALTVISTLRAPLFEQCTSLVPHVRAFCAPPPPWRPIIWMNESWITLPLLLQFIHPDNRFPCASHVHAWRSRILVLLNGTDVQYWNISRSFVYSHTVILEENIKLNLVLYLV